MNKKKAVIALNGHLKGKPNNYLGLFNKKKYTFIAADGGVLFLEKIGIVPDILIGDFDSISQEKLAFYLQQNVEIKEYPVEKDETDGELAINYCLENDFNDIIIIGSRGGRLDQELANIFLLEYAYRNGLNLLLKEPGLEMGIVKEKIKFFNCEGQYLSLIPLSEKVEGVSIKGCKYRLENDTLLRYKTRGISNIIIENLAEVTVKEGIIIYLRLEKLK